MSAAPEARDVDHARRPALSAARSCKPPTRRCCSMRRGRCELLQAPVARGRRQPQPDAARARERSRLRRSSQPRRPDDRLRAGARHRRRRARWRRSKAPAARSPWSAPASTSVYPRRHRELAHRIARKGSLISEFALGTPPLAENFPIRNRIIAGLTRGTLVVEAALQSGSLITARLAVEAGRDVFAIPGSIHSPQSRGCHALIKQGAKLVDSAEDIARGAAALRSGA